MKSIWIINQYATSPSHGPAGRHFRFGKELARHGYKVVIVAGSGHYFHRERPELTGSESLENIEGVDFIWLKTPHYEQGQTFVRVLSWVIFLVRLAFFRIVKIGRPDFIVHSSPSLIPFLGSYFLAWHYKAKIIFEFRDIWPMTFTDIGNYSRLHPVVILHGWIEKFALKKSDMCFGSMEMGSKRLAELGIKNQKYCWLPNGIDYNQFADALPNKEKFGLDKSQFTFGYVGSHGKANALETIVEAAAYLNGEPVNILMTGGGSEREKLKEKVLSMKLQNIRFADRVSKNEVPILLASLDGFLISWQDKSIYRYGTSANKLAEYLAAGKPIVQSYSGACDAVEKYGAGITVSANSARSMAQAMLEIATSDGKRLATYGQSAQKAAKDNFRFTLLATKFINVLKELE